jgi:hypothetical protein
LDAPDTAARSTAVNTAAFALGSIAAATVAESLSGATWTQNWPQPRGIESLPRPTADLFAQAGAILAERAAHGGATSSELAAIIARSSAHAARLGVEGAPSASAEQRGQRHGP